MRDLNLNELEMVYGAGSCGRNNSPAPPSCGGSKSKKSKSKSNRCKGSKSKKHSKSHRSSCYC